MKIAVAYDHGNVFPHFGRTEDFKLYMVENGHIMTTEIVSTDGLSHEALVDVLKKHDIDVVLCGGIGEGAKKAIDAADISLCSGVNGYADEAVERYLAGEIFSTAANCNHHDNDCESCTEDCSSCHKKSITGVNVGRRVKVHYTGTLDDGTVFDSSYDEGKPIEFTCGVGMMIPGFDKAVADMKQGEKKTVHIEPEDAYGHVDPEAMFTTKISEMPGSEGLAQGQQIYLQDMYGRPFTAVVAAIDDDNITIDANHPLAGKALNFEIELVEVVSQIVL